MKLDWLGGRDSNPDRQIQNLQSYHWTTSQDLHQFTRRPGLRSRYQLTWLVRELRVKI